MNDAIVVLNAGSSGLKFLVFAQRDGNFDLIALGLVVGLLEGWSIHESIYFAFVSGTGMMMLITDTARLA